MLRSRVEAAATEYGSDIVLPLDVSPDEQIDACFTELGKHWTDGFDILVHCIAYAPREAIGGDFLDGLTRENFSIAQDISAYSLAALAKAARPAMQGRNGAILTLTYLGSIRALQNYNVMGVAKASLESTVRYLALNLGPEGTRVNAISAGPIKTLAASGVGNFRKMLSTFEAAAPLRQRHHRGRRQRRGLHVLRPGGRHHRRGHLRRRRLQHRGHARHRLNPRVTLR